VRQYSVFEIDVTKAERVELEDDIESVIEFGYIVSASLVKTIRQTLMQSRLMSTRTSSDGLFMDYFKVTVQPQSTN
jgi:CRISPR/Cas system-associated endoribonuclease Cas2